MIGYGFMGATHSVGWRQAPRMFDLPEAVEMTVVVGRNADAAASAAERGVRSMVGSTYRRVPAVTASSPRSRRQLPRSTPRSRRSSRG